MLVKGRFGLSRSKLLSQACHCILGVGDCVFHSHAAPMHGFSSTCGSVLALVDGGDTARLLILKASWQSVTSKADKDPLVGKRWAFVRPLPDRRCVVEAGVNAEEERDENQSLALGPRSSTDLTLDTIGRYSN